MKKLKKIVALAMCCVFVLSVGQSALAAKTITYEGTYNSKSYVVHASAGPLFYEFTSTYNGSAKKSISGSYNYTYWPGAKPQSASSTYSSGTPASVKTCNYKITMEPENVITSVNGKYYINSTLIESFYCTI